MSGKDDLLHWRRRRHTSSHTRETVRETIPDDIRQLILDLGVHVETLGRRLERAEAEIDALETVLDIATRGDE